MGEEVANNPGDMPEEQSKMPAVQESEEGRYRVLSNGAKYDLAAGRIVQGPPLSGSQARELVAKRQAKAQAAVRRAIVAADTTHAIDKRNVYGGFETIAAAQVTLALMPEQGRASTEAAKFLAKASGLMQEAEAGQAAGGSRPLEALGAETLLALVAFMRQKRDGG